jgi:hypothetical protein
MALGSMIMETVAQLRENPYLQYFIGLERYQYEAPFDASMLTYFRKRLKYADMAVSQEELLKLNLRPQPPVLPSAARLSMTQSCGYVLHLSPRLTIIPGVPPDEIRPSGHLCQPVGGSIVSHTASRTAT